MKIEMNPPSTRDRHRSGSRVLELSGRKESDDIQSLSSWSEKLNCSTSSISSTESGSISRRNSSSRHQEGQHKAGSRKSIPDNSSPLGKGSTPYNVPNNVSPECDFEYSDLSSSFTDIDLTMGDCNLQYEYDSPGFSPFNRNKPAQKYESASTQHHPHFRHHKRNSHHETGKSVGLKNTKQVDLPDEKHNVSSQRKLTAQNLYPNLDELDSTLMGSAVDPPVAFQAQDQQIAHHSRDSNRHFSNDVSKRTPVCEPDSKLPEPQRPRFFSKMKQPYSISSQPRSLQTDSRVDCKTHHEPFMSLPTSQSSHERHSEITPGQLSKYRTNNVEHVAHQGKAPPISRLHSSQPSIASQGAHLRRTPNSSNDLEALKKSSFEHQLEKENVKAKVMSVWNNLKYGWTFKSKTSIKYDSPLFMLGKCYHKRKDDPSTEPENDFLKDFVSRIWLTYRNNFYPIPGTRLVTDCGWGCMLRSGQMLIAQCLVTHFLGRDWRLYNQQSDRESLIYREIIRWFSDPIDSPSDQTPFCLHHLARFGRSYNKDPGEWYGPASVAYILRDAINSSRQTIPILSQVCVYVAQDCTVYIDDVLEVCTARPKSESLSGSTDFDSNSQPKGAAASLRQENSDVWLRALILLIPMRLGGEAMNEIYIPCVKSLLSQDNCMGIIGGKPKHSLYFLGWQDGKLIYLDPHFCRDAVDTSEKNFRTETYHCMSPRKLAINKMDPSCTVGFYIRNAEEFKKFVQEVKGFVSPPRQKGSYPLFIFQEGSHGDSRHDEHHNGAEKGRVRITHYRVDENGQRQRSRTRESEDFIML